MADAGMSLAGIRRILVLEAEVRALTAQIEHLAGSASSAAPGSGAVGTLVEGRADVEQRAHA